MTGISKISHTWSDPIAEIAAAQTATPMCRARLVCWVLNVFPKIELRAAVSPREAVEIHGCDPSHADSCNAVRVPLRPWPTRLTVAISQEDSPIVNLIGQIAVVPCQKCDVTMTGLEGLLRASTYDFFQQESSPRLQKARPHRSLQLSLVLEVKGLSSTVNSSPLGRVTP